MTDPGPDGILAQWDAVEADDPRLDHNPVPDKPLWITQADLDHALAQIRASCPVDRNPEQADANIYRTGWHDALEAYHRYLLDEVADYPY